VSRRAPRPLASALAPLQEALAPATLLAAVQRAWPAAAGEAIAREAAPVAERGGVVTIACSASVWAQELDLMAPLLIEKLNAAVAPAEVRRLRCITSHPPRRGPA
jgi:predicted nucleic acid-binding Zn ribbon protein